MCAGPTGDHVVDVGTGQRARPQVPRCRVPPPVRHDDDAAGHVLGEGARQPNTALLGGDLDLVAVVDPALRGVLRVQQRRVAPGRLADAGVAVHPAVVRPAVAASDEAEHVGARQLCLEAVSRAASATSSGGARCTSPSGVRTRRPRKDPGSEGGRSTPSGCRRSSCMVVRRPQRKRSATMRSGVSSGRPGSRRNRRLSRGSTLAAVGPSSGAPLASARSEKMRHSSRRSCAGGHRPRASTARAARPGAPGG